MRVSCCEVINSLVVVLTAVTVHLSELLSC